MFFEFTVQIEAEREEGKFASRDDLEAQLQEALESADPGSLYGENDGVYNTVQWDVNPVVKTKAKR